jgi:hypothetical protein
VPLYGRVKLVVRRGDDAQIHRYGRVAADPLKFLFLEDAQEFCLQFQGEIADLVEEHRAAVCQFQLALLELVRPGESPFLVTEKFTLQQLFGEAGAVDGDKWLQSPVAPIMNRPSEELFAGAAFTEKQHGGFARGGFARFRYDLPHGFAVARDEAVAATELLGKEFNIGAKLRPFQIFFNHQREMFGIERLGDEIVGAGLDRFHRELDAAVRGDDYNG